MDDSPLYAGAVYDALQQAGVHEPCVMSPAIKPLENDSQILGPAYTCRGEIVASPDDYATVDRIRLEMYSRIEPHQVVVLQAGSSRDCTHSGDIGSLIYQQIGACGFVTDGNVRDSRLIRQMHFPCFCRGTNPVDALNKWAITVFDTVIVLPGIGEPVTIRPGDWIYGDSDGVLRIPAEATARVWDLVKEVIKKEDSCREWIKTARGVERVVAAARQAYERFGRW